MSDPHPMQQMAFLESFRCLGADCEDTCCKSWSMQVDDATFARYEKDAPELKDFVEEAGAGRIMKRDQKTDYCVKFENGLCGIHAKYSSQMLGDACHFYPRVTRSISGQAVMTAAMSCPETVRLALFAEGGFGLNTSDVDRLPYDLKEYAGEGLSAEDALKVHEAFLEAALADGEPEHNMACVVSVAQSLKAIDPASLGAAVPFYLKSAEARLMPAEPAEADPFNLLHALMGIVKAAGAENRDRLRATIGDMEKALQVELDWDGLGIRATGDSAAAYKAMEQKWESQWAQQINPVLRRWIAAQLSLALFPFAGFGADAAERALLMGVRFATVRLAMMCACQMRGAVAEEADQVRIIQSLARVLDHLADPALSLQIYEEPGWLREGRLRALMGDG